MGQFWKLARILEIAARIAKIMCNFWNSCRNMTVLRFRQYLSIRCPCSYSENELNFEPLGEREYMCHFWNFGQWPSMQVSCPNMAILKISHYVGNRCPFRSPGIERECMSLLLELWPMVKLVVKQSAKVHGPLVSFAIALGLEKEPKLSPALASPLYKLILMNNLHPVRVGTVTPCHSEPELVLQCTNLLASIVSAWSLS